MATAFTVGATALRNNVRPIPRYVAASIALRRAGAIAALAMVLRRVAPMAPPKRTPDEQTPREEYPRRLPNGRAGPFRPASILARFRRAKH